MRSALVLLSALIPAPVLAQDLRATKPVDVSSEIEAKREEQNDSVDPTANVIALNRAATQRQDDLRNASERFILESIAAVEKLSELRFVHGAELRAAESRRLDDLIALRADYQQQLVDAEAKRIDAIRAVDVNAVQTASERTVEQANVLALNVDRSAETLRSLVATTAQSVAAAQDQLATTLSTRLSVLEQAQYVGQGRQGVTDPAFTELLEEVKALRATQNMNEGQDTGSSGVITLIFAVIGSLGVLVGIGATVFALTRSKPKIVV